MGNEQRRKHKPLTKEQKKFLDHLRETKDISLTIDQLGVTFDKIRDWRKLSIAFDKDYLELLGLTKLQESFIEAYGELGNIAHVCKKLGITRRTYHNWNARNDEFRALFDEVRESMIDEVESKLISNIRGGDTTSIIFFLKTQGRHRGYIEKQEQMITQSTTHTFKNMSDEELDALLDKLSK